MINFLRVPALPVAATVALAARLAAGSPAPALACDAEPLIGSVCMTAATYCPRGYYEANGETLPGFGGSQDQQALFALLGYHFDVANTDRNLMRSALLCGVAGLVAWFSVCNGPNDSA